VGDVLQGAAADCNSAEATRAWFDSRVAHQVFEKHRVFSLQRNKERKLTLTLPSGLFKRGNTYSVRFSIPTEMQSKVGRKEIIRSLGTTDLGEALSLRPSALQEIRDSIQQGSASPALPKSPTVNPKTTPAVPLPAEVPTVRETAHRWLVESDGICGATKQKYRMILRAFEDYSGNCQVSQINRTMALGFIGHIKGTPSKRTGECRSSRSVGSYQACLASYYSSEP